MFSRKENFLYNVQYVGDDKKHIWKNNNIKTNKNI